MAGLLVDGPARQLVSREALHAPPLVDSEVASALRGQVLGHAVDEAAGRAAPEAWRRLGLTRYASPPLLPRVWALRAGLTAYGATCVALAGALGCPLVTADGRLSRAPRVACAITTVPG